MNETRSRHATATAFVLLSFCFIAPHAGRSAELHHRSGWSPRPPGPAAVWLTHILPRGDLAVREFNQGPPAHKCRGFQVHRNFGGA